MDFRSIKAKWQGFSTRKKWLVGGVGALIVIAAANAGNQQDHGGYAVRAGSDRDGPIQGIGQGQAMSPGYAGGQAAGPAEAPAGGGYGPPGGYYGPSGGGYSAPGAAAVASGTDGPDIMGDYEARERSKDMSARAFTQLQRDQTDLRDERTGDITTDVPNDVANPAIESGSYSAAPAADVATATDADPQ